MPSIRAAATHHKGRHAADGPDPIRPEEIGAAPLAAVDNLAATATTLAAGTEATVTVTGDLTGKVINLGLPRGADGPRGQPGMGYEQGQALLDQNAGTLAAAQTAATDAADAIRANLADDLGTPGTPAYEALVDVAGTITDPQTAGLVSDTSSATRSALDTDYARREVFHADTYRAGTTNDLEALHAACADATAAGRGSLVHLSGRTWDVGAGLKMAGYSCGLVGVAAGHDGTAATGTVLHATAQSGPVLDLEGLVAPSAMRGRLPFRNFAVRGSGVADPTGANCGIGNTSTAFASVVFSDIAISDTGGPCVDVTKSYLSHYERLTLTPPVSAQANDIPWIVTRATRGNRFYSIGFRSVVMGGVVGVGGALVSTGDGAGQVSGGDLWHGTWFEALHAPTNGTLIHCEGNGQVIADTYFVDCGGETGSTNTSLVRFAPNGGGSNFPGGNIWRGAVPGRNSIATHTVTTGILVQENNTHIEGPKEQRGSNVTLDVGVTGAYIALGGSQRVVSGQPTPSVVDNSGNNDNTYLDYAAGAFTLRGYRVARGTSGPQFLDPANPANGRVQLGTGGVQIQAANGGLYLDGNSVRFRNGATEVSFNMGNRPGINLPNSGPGLAGASAGLRGRMLLVHGGAGQADQMYVCRKKADDTYEWAPLT